MDPVLSSILGPVCKRVIDALIEEHRLVRDVKEEIRNLRRTVAMIKDVLEDAERKQIEGGGIREWLKSLKQVLFDAEDVFDEIATTDEALGRGAEDGTTRSAAITRLLSKVRSKLVSCLCNVDHSSSNRAIAHRVKDINKKLDDISKSKEKLGLRVSNETSGSVFRRPRPDTSSLVPSCEAHIIGRDGEMQKIEELLLEYSAEGNIAASSDNYKNVHVINVVGMGGVGKTTLVKHAYNSPAVAEYFQLRMWVCVSNYFDVKRITREIVDAVASSSEQTRDEFVDTLNWDVVQNRLKGKLEGKRFLLVLDDMWEENPEMWVCLCTPLMCGGKGSKIIVTTRSQVVSNNTKGTPIPLKDLPRDDLLKILKNYAFDGHDPVKYPQLVFEGKKIVDKLKGSPLAARTIGRVLNENLDVRVWTNILSSKAWVSSNSKDNILPILKLSYDHLLGHLKQCFTYCSLFSEDYEFDKHELVQLWMAQQFIIQISGESFHVETEGGVYFDKLVHMSLFEKYTNIYGQTRFVMHDLIHNLAEIVSEGDCLRLEDNQQNGTISDTVRHVSIASVRFDLSKIEQLCNKYENMRTLLFLRGCNFQLDHHLHNIFTKLQRLRVLGLSRCGIKELHASIGALKHLRLLDLSFNSISNLPESLCNLRNLQVLNLVVCGGIDALPRNMSALINLRHLKTTNDELVSGIEGLGKLTALHELTFDCGRMQPIKELADMGMLRRLRIRSLEKVKSREQAIQSRLDKKEHLVELTLEWSDLCRDDDDDVNHPEVLDRLRPSHSSIRHLTIHNYGGSRSPSWMEDQSWLRDSCFLETLELRWCKNWEVLPPLGQLLCLDSLKIRGMRRVRRMGPAFMGCCLQLPQGGFPSLQLLEFEHMEEWEEWEVPRGTDDDGGEDDQVFLARLQKLTIEDCPKLRQLPPLPPTLTKLKIKYSGLTRLPGWRLPPSSSLPCCSPSSTSSTSPYSLCSLEIDDCPNLEGDDDGEDDQVLSDAPPPPPRRQHRRRPLFLALLRELTIKSCPKLRQLPPLPPTLTKLYIENVGLTHLPEWWLPPSPLASSYSSSPCSLSSLQIRDCPELTSLADGLLRHSLPNLVKLYIYNCPGLVSLPADTAFGHLTSLKELEVEWCPKLAWASTCESPSVEDGGLPPSLESITIQGGCGEVMDQMMLAIVSSGQKLACLRKLHVLGPRMLRTRGSSGNMEISSTWLRCPVSIETCPAVTPPPPPTLRRSLPSSLQELTICDMDQLDDETLLAWLRGLTSLGEFSISDCPAVTSLPRAEVLSHLTALKKLEITRLKALSSFGGGIHCLVSLEELIIEDCPELLDIATTAADSSRPSSSSALPSPARSVGTSTTTRIRILYISGSSMQQIKTWLLQCPSLPELSIGKCDVGGDLLEAALLNLSGTLQRLQFYYCENLRSLPPRLRCLSSLQSLEIFDCPQIRSLPVAGLPESLQYLSIYGCPELVERCKEGVGSDWPLISHIPEDRRSIR